MGAGAGNGLVVVVVTLAVVVVTLVVAATGRGERPRWSEDRPLQATMVSASGRATVTTSAGRTVRRRWCGESVPAPRAVVNFRDPIVSTSLGRRRAWRCPQVGIVPRGGKWIGRRSTSALPADHDEGMKLHSPSAAGRRRPGQSRTEAAGHFSIPVTLDLYGTSPPSWNRAAADRIAEILGPAVSCRMLRQDRLHSPGDRSPPEICPPNP